MTTRQRGGGTANGRTESGTGLPAPPATLDALLDLHHELCVDSRRPSLDWFRRCRIYDATRRQMERAGVNVEIAVLKRFMPWASPDEVALSFTARRSKVRVAS